jgi:pyruvate kinase
LREPERYRYRPIRLDVRVYQVEKLTVDDGKISARVESVSGEAARIKVEQTPLKGARVATGKGINFPGLELNLPPLSPADLAALPFVAQHADLIGYSFVQRPPDLELLDDALAQARPVPLLLKIETRLAVSNLPELLVASGSRRPTGVMIARGDLAVELGYQRLAEMQEELLWLCEAAHTPVVWATQVLERLVKKGTPARGEVTDAAAASQSECVMLNKGPFLVEAVELLDDVLRRMQSHRAKKTPLLRPLRAWS